MERLTERKRNNDGSGISTQSLVIENGMRKGFPSGHCGRIVTKLADYEDLEEQGLLLRLPCKVGDRVYSLDRFCGGYSSDCPSRPCKSCPDYQLEIYETTFKLNDIYEFNKTVFLTREEAEKTQKSDEILVHGVMKYRCESCGHEWLMFLEKGIEEFGDDHKPSPFVIRCRCGGMARDVSGIIKLASESGYTLLPEGMSYFANRKDSDCGVPILRD